MLLADTATGTYAYLKNFRKGLRHQRERCELDLQGALPGGDRESAATAAAARKRLLWIHEKQIYLDTHHEMIIDQAGIWMGELADFGSLEPDARRPLSVDEIRWNREMIGLERTAPARPKELDVSKSARVAPTARPPDSGSAVRTKTGATGAAVAASENVSAPWCEPSARTRSFHAASASWCSLHLAWRWMFWYRRKLPVPLPKSDWHRRPL